MSKWTEEEIEYLKSNYMDKTDIEMSKVLINHTLDAITTKRKKLKLHQTNRRHCIEEFIDYCSKKDYVLITKEFSSCANNAEFICNKHYDKGIQSTTFRHMLEGKGCIYCARESVNQAVRSRIKISDVEQWCLNNNCTLVSIEHDRLAYVNFICNIHKEYGIQTKRWNNMRIKHQGCSLCTTKISKGESKVVSVLDKYNLKYITQYTFDDLYDIGKLKFDFYLPDYNLCIEYDGEQHFQPIRFNGCSIDSAKKTYDKIQIHDRAKDKYCQDNNIKLIRICYTQYNDIEEIIANEIVNSID